MDGATDNGYEPGKLYQITIPNNYQFKELESHVTDYKFRIYKDAVMTAEANKDIKFLLTSELVSFSDEENDTYIFMITNSVFEHHQLQVNDIVSIAEEYECNENNEKVLDTDNSTVIKITGYKKIGNDYLVEAVQASLGEIFKDVDVNFVNVVPVSQIMETIEKSDMENELENSEGVKKMSRLLATSIGNSTSVRKALAGDDNFTNNNYIFEESVEELKIKFKDVKITVKIGQGHNPNFDPAHTDEFCVISFTFEYEATIKKKIKIKAKLELTQYIAITMQGDSDFSLKKSYLRFEYAFNVYSQTDIDLTVLMCSIAEDDEKYKDISKEISEKLATDNDENSNLLTEFQDMFDNDSGDIELMKVPIIRGKLAVVPIIHVFDVNTNLDFVVKINFGAGINIDASVLEAVQVGAKGDTKTGDIKSIKNELPGGDQYSLELSAFGYLGVKLGFEASLTISFCGASKFGEVGIAVFVGPYVDLYGYVKMSLSRSGYVPSKYVAKTVKSQVIGGYYIEIGINVEVELIARSDFFKVKAGVDLLNIKIPIVTFGSKDVLYEVVESKDERIILMNDSTNENKFSIDYRNFIYAQGEFLDITTGKTNVKDISWNNFHLTFDNRCFSYNSMNGDIIYDRTKNNNVYTDECTVTMYYTGSYLKFSPNAEDKYRRCPAGTVTLIWTDTTKVSPENAGKTFNINIQFYVDDELMEERNQPVRAGKVLGYIPNPYSGAAYCNKSWNIDSFTEIINGDTTFIYRADTRLVYVAFMYFDVDNCKWKMEIRSVKLGDVPVAPEIKESEKVHFKNWKASVGYISHYQSIPSTGLSPVIGVEDIYTHGCIDSMFITGYAPDETITEWEDENYWQVYNLFDDVRISDGSSYYYITVQVYIADYTFDDCKLSIVFPEDINENHNYNYELTVPFGAKYYNYQLAYYSPEDRRCIGFSLNEDLSEPLDVIPPIYEDTTVYFIYGYKDYNINLYYYDDLLDEYILYSNDLEYSGLEDLNSRLTDVDQKLVKEDNVSYEVCGWSYKYNGVYKDLTNVSGDLELYPNYIRTYDITFDPNGGELQSLNIVGNKVTMSTKLINGSKELTLEIIASKEDNFYEYEFLGWENTTTGEIYKAWFPYEFTDPTTLKAVWGEPVEKVYSVTVVTGQGTLLNGERIHNFEGNYDEYLKFIESYREYKIDDIYDEANGRVISFELEEKKLNLSDYVNYLCYVSINQILPYTLTINANGGELPEASIKALEASGTQYYPVKYLGTYVDDENNNVYQFQLYFGRLVYLSNLEFIKASNLKYTYVFNYYTDLDNQTYSETDTIKINSDLTLNVNWNEEYINYSITYYVNDEEIGQYLYHYEDEIIEEPRPSDTMKYKWSGWIWYEGEKVLDNAPTEMTNANYIVKSTTEEVKITYLLNDETYYESVVDANSEIVLLDKFVKEGYIVTDWSTTEVEVIDNKFIMPENNVIFTSTSKKAKYKVTYLDLNGEVDQVFEYEFGQTVSTIELPKEENKYYAWTSDDVSIVGSSFTIIAKDITIKLIEATKQYHLIYVINNEIASVEYFIPGMLKEIGSIIDDRQYEGKFSGWYSKDVEIKNNTITTIDQDIYIYGYYSTGDIKINVSLDREDISLVLYGNSGYVIKGYKSQNNFYLDELLDDGTLMNEILIKLHNFNIIGWKLNNQEETYSSIILTDEMTEISIQAVYNNQYKVSYELNDLGNYQESPEELEQTYQTEYYNVGAKVYLKNLPTLVEVDYRSDYLMLEWFTTREIEIIEDENGKYFIMPEYDITLNTTEYYYNEEDGFKASIYIKLPDSTKEVLYCERMVGHQFSVVAPQIDGYYFVYLKDEEGNEYFEGEQITTDVMSGKNRKFTAIYEKITQQIATFRVNGSIIGYTVFDSYLGCKIEFPVISLDEGMKLSYWFNEDGSITYDFFEEYNQFTLWESDLLGQDFIFDAILIDESSSFNLDVDFSAENYTFNVININYENYVYNIVENTSFTLANEYFDRYYDIKLYITIDFEEYKDLSSNYTQMNDNTTLVTIPSIEDIYQLFTIENEEELFNVSIIIKYISQNE